jgi:hypothetical protein
VATLPSSSLIRDVVLGDVHVISTVGITWIVRGYNCDEWGSDRERGVGQMVLSRL